MEPSNHHIPSVFKPIFLALAALILLAVSASAAELVRDGRGFRGEKVHEIKTSPDGRLDLGDITGDVTVISWDKNLVRIVENVFIDVYTKEEAEKAFEEYTLRIDERGKVIKALGPSHYRGYIDISYRITLPKEYSAEISTSGGDFDVSGLKGKYSFTTSGGDIVMEHCEGDIEGKTSGGDLELENIKGTLRATTSGGDIMCYNCGEELELRTSGGDIELRKLTGRVDARTSGGDIELLGMKGCCELKTSGGDITLRNIESKKIIQAGTSGGDIEVKHVMSDVEVKTSGGDISADGIEGSLDASTSGGDISANMIARNVTVSTSGGDIEIDDIGGFVKASTSGGDIEVKILQYNPKADQHIDLKSSGGSLELALPKDFKATVRAVINIRGARWDEYDIYSDFPLKVSKEDENRDEHSRRRYEGSIIGVGEINGGGNLIDLETTNGNITIKKR